MLIDMDIKLIRKKQGTKLHVWYDLSSERELFISPGCTWADPDVKRPLGYGSSWTDAVHPQDDSPLRREATLFLQV